MRASFFFDDLCVAAAACENKTKSWHFSGRQCVGSARTDQLRASLRIAARAATVAATAMTMETSNTRLQ